MDKIEAHQPEGKEIREIFSPLLPQGGSGNSDGRDVQDWGQE